MSGKCGSGRKLSDWQVNEARSMRRGGASMEKIARWCGVSVRTVQRYLNERKGAK